eukprot:TRINITY_DN75517_c0_g1_i1.p1 TRINITY_DN75517_c0_g1~~TRINITY_DN75517_c0_g1_i1.p1  ORF type:complete len:696 (+),score=111.54 TRINITY_DN75517_c0_g1_i1:105-2192(+)
MAAGDDALPFAARPPREPPPHQCDACPGGSFTDPCTVFERDAWARCLVDSCHRKDSENPLASRLVDEEEWESFLFTLRERGLADDAGIELLRHGSAGDGVVGGGGPYHESVRAGHGGLDIWDLQRWLVRNTPYGGKLRDIDRAAEGVREALHAVNIAVGVRGIESLSTRELYTYQVLLSEYEHGVADCLHRILDRLRRSEELTVPSWDASATAAAAATNAKVEAAAAVYGKDTAIEPGPLPQTPQDFQWSRGPEIERRLRDLRVRSVILPPPREQRVLMNSDWGMRRLLGTNASSGAEVLVLEMPWEIPPQHTAKATDVYNRLEALKQLTLSHYFVDYLGCDVSSYSGVGLHFLSRRQGVSLRQLVALAGPLTESHLLFRYWARELLLAMRDYLYQCCQELTRDLTLEHVFVHDEGLQLMLQAAPLGGRRVPVCEEFSECGPSSKWRNGFMAVENRLITMWGNMIVELLHGEQRPGDPVVTLLELTPGLRWVISQAVNARDTFDHSHGLLPCADVTAAGDGEGNSGVGVSTAAKAAETAYWAGGEGGGAASTWDLRKGLAGGFVSAGIDEFCPGTEYELWWERPPSKPLLILPNLEGSADAGSAELEEDWASSDLPQKVGGDKLVGGRKWDIPRLHWEPNPSLFTIQELLDRPELRCPKRDVHLIMEAWDEYYQRFKENRHKHARLERFLDACHF